MRLPDLLEDGQRSMPPLCVLSVCGGIPLAAWQQSAHRRGKTEGRAADVRPPRRESRVLWALHLNPADLHYVAFMAGVNRMAWSRFFLYNAANGLPWSGIYAGARAGLPAGPAPAHVSREPWSARARTVARLAVGRMKRAARVRSFHVPKRLLGGCSFTRGFPTRLPAGGAPRGRRRRPLRNPAPRRITYDANANTRISGSA